MVPLKLAVVGVGSLGQHHARILANMPGVKLVGVIDPNAKQAETIAAIVKASELPMSIVIVGVGSADFSAMNQLDADNKMLKDRDGNVAQRDIVQFVPFRDYAKQQISALAAATLAELPRQFCDFMKAKGLKPIGQS